MYSAMLFVGLFVLFLFILALIGYIPFSLGLFRMAQKCGIENPWLAWVPYADLYIMGRLVRTLRLGRYEVHRPEWSLPAAGLLGTLLAGVPFIGVPVSLAVLLLIGLALYRLNLIFKRESALLFTVLWLVPLVGPFLILSVSKYDPESDYRSSSP